MAKVKPALIAFNGGEIGPETLARTDLDVYPRCAEVAENVFLYPQGKMSLAPGTMYIGEAAAGETVFVRPFEYSVGDNLILVLSDTSLQFVKGEAFVTIEGAAATLAGWTDESAAPSTGGGTAPPATGGGTTAPGSGGGGDLASDGYLTGSPGWFDGQSQED